MTATYNDFLALKSQAGLHSPSVFELTHFLKLRISVDACFLCNPYAFELCKTHLLVRDLTDYIKFYPPQNQVLASILSPVISIQPDHLLLGNGAIQLIELLTRMFNNRRKCVITPTFSSYYEHDSDNIHYFQTCKEDGFRVDLDALVTFCKARKIDVLFIVNPNNPTAIAIERAALLRLAEEMPSTTLVVDESFIDFFDRSQTLEGDVTTHNNIIVVRSLSKDFGIAGLRLGYAVCKPHISAQLRTTYGLCWNINGLAHAFLEIFATHDFQQKYQEARRLYLAARSDFYNQLTLMRRLSVYKSQANFFIVDCHEHVDEVFSQLLFSHGIYTRILNDKLHLPATFLRIACGAREDNQAVCSALTTVDSTL